MKISENLNYWINWAILAVYGKMAAADHIMRQHGAQIGQGATELMLKIPIDIDNLELYRGMVINDKFIQAGMLPHMDSNTFMSFTEELSVACYFGNPQSDISKYLAIQDPNAKGYIATHHPRREGEILFHYWWAQELKLYKMAAMHPHIEDPMQFRWYVNTQFEVITKPVEQLAVKPIEEFNCLSVEQLNEMYTPPHLRDA